VQVYNAPLTGSQIAYLYQSGIYGIPTNTANLAAWWPLNGNPNDYSGHFNLGIPSNILYAHLNAMPVSLKNAYDVGAATVPLSIPSQGLSSLYNVSVISWR